MTITFELSPEEEARLRIAARERGTDPTECAHRLLTDCLPSLRPGEATLALFATWEAEDATDDPNMIREAEEELAEFKKAMNRNRLGQRPLYR